MQWATCSETNTGDLHDHRHRLRDEFFYNVNIYKQLQDHDLKINLKKKEDLIAQAAQLGHRRPQEKEMLAWSYMKAWFDVGPSPRRPTRTPPTPSLGTLGLRWTRSRPT